MINSKLRLTGLFLISLLLGGCAASRGTVSLATPTTQAAQMSNNKQIYINTVEDKRVFELKPGKPSIPSLNPDRPSSDDIKSRAIARKLNGFGQAFGDILLENGQTVSALMRNTLQQALIANGYKVIENKSQITPETYILDAKVNQFWSWMNPAVFAIDINTVISTDISISDPSGIKNSKIEAKASDSYQLASGKNWIEVMQKALANYVKEAQSKL
ncbi:hypothetical protein [Undibacterium sp.]|uniref:hypothetical protein n=1 Tax=Undibacterium sp. TaxID=1914977 RepID=UPI0025DB6712|nr:hypothetical protein [Undibacterium sp.]